MKLLGLLLTAAAALVFSSGTALAFHDGGVAECAGCHTMHNSQDGELVDASAPIGNNYLLVAANSTDVCLSCHAAYGQFDAGLGYGPGGDFYWITKTFSWEGHGGTEYSTGDSHGHNVLSPAHGIEADAILTDAPGGDFDSDYLTCTSCHDPHGNQSFRILYGSALGPIYPTGRYDFVNQAPLAKGNSRKTYVGGGGNETNARHTVYKSGMSEWCSNCHTDFHAGNTDNFVHPTGEDMGTAVAGAYNAYVSTDNVVGGLQATAYWGLAPFEAVNVNLATVSTTNNTVGPAPSDQVMCLSCHRAHASPFADAGRWDFGQTYVVDSHPQATDGGATEQDVANKYYQYTFVNNQRSLCNKCHVKDFGDRPRP
jgi:hypothetical protein